MTNVIFIILYYQNIILIIKTQINTFISFNWFVFLFSRRLQRRRVRRIIIPEMSSNQF